MIRKISEPSFYYEQQNWNKGRDLVVGCDEVGRGSLAGPVVTASVVFPKNLSISIRINDSKALTPNQREAAAEWIKKEALAYAVGVGSVTKINKKGIVGATDFAFRSSVNKVSKQLNQLPHFLLTDAFYIPYVRNFPKSKQLAIIRGDSLSYSIAAASIIAKVYRDLLMSKLAKKHSNYGWEINKGYATKIHREAIKQFGPTIHHRTLFLRKI